MHKNASTCIQPIYKYIFVFQAKLGYVWSRKAQNAGVKEYICLQQIFKRQWKYIKV